MRNNFLSSFIACLLLAFSFSHQAAAADLKIVRVGVLKFGTVNWTLDILKHNQLDKKHGFNLEIIPLGSKNASAVALQGGGADMIVSDWLWVSRQRADNRDYTFVPYSNATGALMVKEDSGIDSLADLKGKKLGIAGGPVDKSWLFLRAYTQKTQDMDLSNMIEPQFGAPPLLNELAQRGDLDGVLNFWHFTARLQASGFKPLLTVPEALKGLGIEASIPVIGWVFSEQWAADNIDAVNGFIAASREAQMLLAENDAQWLQVRQKMKAKDEDMFNTLRDAYRNGIPGCFGVHEKQAAKTAFAILAELGGKKLIGDSNELSEGTFWNQLKSMECKG